MEKNKDKKDVQQHVEDFFDGIYDTVVGVPTAFGDFLGRVSGFRDWQNEGILDLKNVEQTQALLEVKILYEAFTHETSRNIIKETLKNDFEERPAYYIGGMGIQTGLATTLSKIAKVGYSTTMINAKSEKAIHEKYNKIKDISELEDEQFNILTDDIISSIDWFDNFETNINIRMKESESQINDIFKEEPSIAEDNVLLDDENIISEASVKLKNENQNTTVGDIQRAPNSTAASIAAGKAFVEDLNLSTDNSNDQGYGIGD